MQFANCVRNEFGKCDRPENTIARIREGLGKLGLKPEYSGVRLDENLYWGQSWIDNIRIICEGKGISPELSEASALAELTERFSAGMFYPSFEKEVRFNMPALYSREVSAFLNFEWMPGYVYAHQDELSEEKVCIEDLLVREKHLGEAHIRDIKGSDMAKHWVDGYSLGRGRTVKVPLAFAAYIHGSNGMAAGNTLEEAMLQACGEIFERYAQIETVGPEKDAPTIDRDSVGIPRVRDMISFYESQGVEVRIKDLSFGGSLPVLGVLFTNTNLPPDALEHNILIAGAAFNSDEALLRCFTEGAQGRKDLRYPRKQLDKKLVPRDQVPNHYLLMRCGVSLKDISFLKSGPVTGYAPWQRQDLEGEIDSLVHTCRDMGTDCVLVDQTHPVMDFPVVRMVVPGMSDFLPFINRDVLTHPKSRPNAPAEGRAYLEAMRSFFYSR